MTGSGRPGSGIPVIHGLRCGDRPDQRRHGVSYPRRLAGRVSLAGSASPLMPVQNTSSAMAGTA
jgi:hypothetical protein